MKRVNNDPTGKLVFEAKSGTNYEAATAINHGLELPTGKFLLSMGVYINGYLETNSGRKIEVALRKAGSYSIHLCADLHYTGVSKAPIRLFPDLEYNDEINVPNKFFLPYYNCHGCTFEDSKYWINPMCYERDTKGNITPVSDNLSILLEDEYIEVKADEAWDAAVFFDLNSKILHSVKQIEGQILCKYDGYQLEIYSDITKVDTSRYGNGDFKFFKCK